MSLRCLIVDDSPRFLAAARDLLEAEGMTVIAVATTAEEAVARVREAPPDVALVDIALGDDCGFATVRRLAAEGVRNLILISTRDEEEFAELIAESPAQGFVAKSRLCAGAIEAALAR